MGIERLIGIRERRILVGSGAGAGWHGGGGNIIICNARDARNDVGSGRGRAGNASDIISALMLNSREHMHTCNIVRDGEGIGESNAKLRAYR